MVSADLEGGTPVYPGLVRSVSSERVNGLARADVTVSGTLGAPRAHADIESSGLRFHDTGPGTLRTEVVISPDHVQIASFEASIGADTLRASGRLALVTGAIEGQADWTIPDLAALAGNVPRRFRPVGALTGQAVVAGRWPDATVRATLSGTGLTAAGQQVDRWSADVRFEDRASWSTGSKLEQAEGRLSMRGECALERSAHTRCTSAAVSCSSIRFQRTRRPRPPFRCARDSISISMVRAPLTIQVDAVSSSSLPYRGMAGSQGPCAARRPSNGVR